MRSHFGGINFTAQLRPAIWQLNGANEILFYKFRDFMQLLSCSGESCITIHTLKNNIIRNRQPFVSASAVKKWMDLKSLPFPLSHKNSRGLSQFKLLSSDTVWFLRNTSMGFGWFSNIAPKKLVLFYHFHFWEMKVSIMLMK